MRRRLLMVEAADLYRGSCATVSQMIVFLQYVDLAGPLCLKLLLYAFSRGVDSLNRS